MEPTPEPSSLTTNSVSESERDDLLDAIIAAITALAIVKKAEPIRNHLAYRKTLAKNSIEELRESAAQLQRVLDGEGKPRTLTQNEIAEQECESENTSQADCAEDFFRDAAILDDAEEIGRAYFDTLPESTRDTLVNEEITAHLASPQKSTWLRWDKSFQVQEAERILAQRFGLQIIDYPDSKPYDPEKTEIKKPRLSLNFFDHGAGRLPVEVQNGF